MVAIMGMMLDGVTIVLDIIIIVVILKRWKERK